MSTKRKEKKKEKECIDTKYELTLCYKRKKVVEKNRCETKHLDLIENRLRPTIGDVISFGCILQVSRSICLPYILFLINLLYPIASLQPNFMRRFISKQFSLISHKKRSLYYPN